MEREPSVEEVAGREVVDDAVCDEIRALEAEVEGLERTLEYTRNDLLREGLERDRYREASPDDIREQGWSVAVHNDYRIDGNGYTFWLFTKDGGCVKGEGPEDADALNQVRAALGGKEERG